MVFISKARSPSKPKHSHDEMIRRLRLGDLRKLIADRCRHNGGILPDDDAGIDYLRDLLLPISIGPYEARNRVKGGVALWGPVDRMRQEIARWAPWMGDNRIGALLDEINQMPMWQRKPKARTLGERLNVTYGQRQELQLRTIAPCDVSDEAMELIRKRKRRKRDKERRQLQSRADYLATHRISKDKPWEGLGISRRTYYYQLKKANCTSVHPINLKQSSSRPVQSEKRQLRKKEAVRGNSINQVSNQKSQSQKAEMPVIDNQPELMTQTCAKSDRNQPTMLPPDAVPTWVLLLPPDMAAMATVAN